MRYPPRDHQRRRSRAAGLARLARDATATSGHSGCGAFGYAPRSPEHVPFLVTVTLYLLSLDGHERGGAWLARAHLRALPALCLHDNLVDFRLMPPEGGRQLPFDVLERALAPLQ